MFKDKWRIGNKMTDLLTELMFLRFLSENCRFACMLLVAKQFRIIFLKVNLWLGSILAGFLINMLPERHNIIARVSIRR